MNHLQLKDTQIGHQQKERHLYENEISVTFKNNNNKYSLSFRYV
nr:hypothetical protein BAR15_160024 [Bartonella sp. AR 15-3]